MSRLGVIVLIIAASLLGLLSNNLAENSKPWDEQRVRARIGQDARITGFIFHINSVQAASTLLHDPSSYSKDPPVETDGLWVVVNLSYSTIEKYDTPGSIDLVDGKGRKYPRSGRAGTFSWSAGPDTWVGGDLAFEVAKDSLPGLKLVAKPNLGLFGAMPVRILEVELPITDDQIQPLVTTSRYQVLPAGQR